MRLVVFLFSFFIWFIGATTAKAVISSDEQQIEIKSQGFSIKGTAKLPEAKKKMSVLLLIPGSGPTDRDGNQPSLQNNSFKYLADELAKNGIASLRYDKRGIAKSYYPGFTNASILFDNYVEDAANWIRYLKAQDKFTKVYVAGLSEGSLIGMLAVQKAGADGFISLNGPGRPADEIIIQQISKQGMPFGAIQQVKTNIKQIKNGEKLENVPPSLMALFNADIQPYLKSWFVYNPAIEIGKLKSPALIVQGKNDIQVQLEDAELLKKGNTKAKLVLIDGMNHILKNAPADQKLNFETYNKPELPLNEVLLKEIISFIGN